MDKQLKDKIGILGYGEVGKAIAKFYKNPQVKDIFLGGKIEDVDILHICIPYSKEFVKIIKEEITEIKPKLTIIHSTVAPGTTKKIGGAIVHSPIRGIHPNLYRGIRTFLKYIGTDNKKTGEMAKKHFKKLGLKTKVFTPSITTELGKLLSTSYYGLCISFHGEVQEICNKYNVEFKEVMTDFNKTYNNGYKKLDLKNVIRPTLYPPENNIITGHCIIKNAKILRKHFRSKALDLILKYK